ncbi:hypothetical protein AB0L65_61830 [Nonomuraea sp. NPDC052116]|uniref:hypothetical protein n=1 Tax=Nonomuraea sp. NPDC052116 TaxID=3155665 RepID=UPI0034204D57
MFEIVSALTPPLVVGGAFIADVVSLVRSESRARAAEGRRDAPPVEAGKGEDEGTARPAS